MATVQLFRRERLNYARFDTIDREHRDANIESIFYYAVFYPAIEVVSTLATALIIWYGGGGVVGPPGAGKTTLINLLLRFYDVKRGRITIDGVDVRTLDLADVRGLFSLVLQDVHLFSGTVADNIRLGNPAIDADRVRRAAEAVHADPFIARLPGGYQSAVAERGATLSVGQKQLLSFARALAF